MSNCLECKDLNRIFKSELTKYLVARSATFYRISTEFAAKRQVDMERAKNNMEEHLLICPLITKARCLVPVQESSAVE